MTLPTGVTRAPARQSTPPSSVHWRSHARALARIGLQIARPDGFSIEHHDAEQAVFRAVIEASRTRVHRSIWRSTVLALYKHALPYPQANLAVLRPDRRGAPQEQVDRATVLALLSSVSAKHFAEYAEDILESPNISPELRTLVRHVLTQ